MTDPQQNRIAAEISKVLDKEPFVTDIQLREGAPIFVKSPKGLTRLESAPLTKADLSAFFYLISPAQGGGGDEWKTRLKGPTNDFNNSYSMPDCAKRLRINGFEWSGAPKYGAAVRVQPATIPPMEKLGVPEIMKTFLDGKGLVLITGPTGSGKSTTLAAAIEYLNNSKFAYNIITVEDPIEYEISSKNSLVTQREVGTGSLKSMHDGVISALRQNPDVISIGEMRDRETVSVALRAASSGHLVLASMHTNSAKDTAEAILNVFEGEEVATKAQMLSSVLLGIISQQLVPTADEDAFVLVTEVLIVDRQVRNAIKDRKYIELANMMDVPSGDNSSYSLNYDLANFVNDGQITQKAALMATYDPEGLKKKLGIIKT